MQLLIEVRIKTLSFLVLQQLVIVAYVTILIYINKSLFFKLQTIKSIQRIPSHFKLIKCIMFATKLENVYLINLFKDILIASAIPSLKANTVMQKQLANLALFILVLANLNRLGQFSFQMKTIENASAVHASVKNYREEDHM